MKSGHPSTPNLTEGAASSSRPQSPEPTPGSRYTIRLASPSSMQHSASMPNLGFSEPTSPQSPARPLSPVERSSSPLSGNRHTLYVSPVASPTLSSKHPHNRHDESLYCEQLLASIEDALHTCLNDEYCLTNFSFLAPTSSEPSGQFHCIISKIDGTMVINDIYSIFKLRSIENLVECINSHDICNLSAAQIYQGLDQKNILLSPLRTEPGNAVFVTGECPVLGHWESAIRLNYSEHHKAWRFTLPAGITHKDYKFKLGPYSAGKNPDCSILKWEDYPGNRQLLSVQLQHKSPRLGK